MRFYQILLSLLLLGVLALATPELDVRTTFYGQSVKNSTIQPRTLQSISDFLVTQDTKQSHAASASFSDGSFVIVWLDSSQKINFRVYSPYGTPLTNEISASENQMKKTKMAIATHKDKLVILGISNDGANLYYIIFKKDGTTVKTDTVVNLSDHSGIENPAIAAFEDGTFVIVWQAILSSYSNPLIYAKIYNSEFSNAPNEILVSTSVESRDYNPTVATSDYKSIFTVAWQHWDQEPSEHRIRIRGFKKNGTPYKEQFFIFSQGDAIQTNPAIVSLKNGGFALAWEVYNSTTLYSEVYMQTLSSELTFWNAPVRVSPEGSIDHKSPGITSLNENGFAVVWQEEEGANSEVSCQLFGADGSKTRYPFRVNTQGNVKANTPTIATLKDGGFIVLWKTGSLASSPLYAKRFSFKGIEAPFEVQCYYDDDCTDATKPMCDHFDFSCKGCNFNADCDLSRPFCSDHRCSQCISNWDCANKAKSICDTKTRLCRGCMANTDCADFFDTPFCNVSSGYCVKCLQDSDCVGYVMEICEYGWCKGPSKNAREKDPDIAFLVSFGLNVILVGFLAFRGWRYCKQKRAEGKKIKSFDQEQPDENLNASTHPLKNNEVSELDSPTNPLSKKRVETTPDKSDNLLENLDKSTVHPTGDNGILLDTSTLAEALNNNPKPLIAYKKIKLEPLDRDSPIKKNKATAKVNPIENKGRLSDRRDENQEDIISNNQSKIPSKKKSKKRVQPIHDNGLNNDNNEKEKNNNEPNMNQVEEAGEGKNGIAHKNQNNKKVKQGSEFFADYQQPDEEVNMNGEDQKTTNEVNNNKSKGIKGQPDNNFDFEGLENQAANQEGITNQTIQEKKDKFKKRKKQEDSSEPVDPSAFEKIVQNDQNISNSQSQSQAESKPEDKIKDKQNKKEGEDSQRSESSMNDNEDVVEITSFAKMKQNNFFQGNDSFADNNMENKSNDNISVIEDPDRLSQEKLLGNDHSTSSLHISNQLPKLVNFKKLKQREPDFRHAEEHPPQEAKESKNEHEEIVIPEENKYKRMAFYGNIAMKQT